MRQIPKHAGRLTATCLVVIASTLLVGGPAEATKLGPSYRVAGVSDGDTVKVAVRGKVERVRLIGIDTPELGRDGWPDQCHAQAARRAMTKLVKGKRVHLVRDATQANRDTYGRLLRYVYTSRGKVDVGKRLLTRGDGREFTYDNSYRHRSSYRSAERRAQRAGRGVWGSCPSENPVGSPVPPPSPTSPGTCLIKGNIANDGERIYHLPGQQYYRVTVITPAKGERWFCSEADAVAAGWRRSAV